MRRRRRRWGAQRFVFPSMPTQTFNSNPFNIPVMDTQSKRAETPYHAFCNPFQLKRKKK